MEASTKPMNPKPVKYYFHELSDRELDKLRTQALTAKYLAANCIQPRWCGHPDALNGLNGCIALLEDRKKICMGFCSKCEFYLEGDRNV